MVIPSQLRNSATPQQSNVSLNTMALVPIIDMSDFAVRQDIIISEVMAAAEGVGFFQVVNHGVPLELIDSMFDASAGCVSAPFDVI